jgi:oxygen-independent coproporphyrinogen-3 oxidase
MTLPELAGRSDLFEAPESLYIHIPFCSSRCGYCDFHSFAGGRGDREGGAYVQALLSRAEALKKRQAKPLKTLYIGGGTPTALPQDAFRRLLEGLFQLFGSSLNEWTVEANPESLSQEKLAAMIDAGVNRLSIGIQSMEERELEILGRNARRVDNEKALALARRSGMDLSADLIAGVPGQTEKTLVASLLALLDSGVDHVSLYDLSIEAGTALEKKLRQGFLLLPEEDRSYEARKAAEGVLKAAGYSRYEVSNFCRPGKESRHNSAYWAMVSYVGIGSGAVSSLMVTEDADPSSIKALAGDGSTGFPACLRIEGGRDLSAYSSDPDAAASLAWIDERDSAFELVMMGLRTSRGVELRRFKRRFGKDLLAFLAPVLEKWKNRTISGDEFLRLDDEGLDLLNPILLDVLDMFKKP